MLYSLAKYKHNIKIKMGECFIALKFQIVPIRLPPINPNMFLQKLKMNAIQSHVPTSTLTIDQVVFFMH
jgi:hypothetical protein